LPSLASDSDFPESRQCEGGVPSTSASHASAKNQGGKEAIEYGSALDEIPPPHDQRAGLFDATRIEQQISIDHAE